jgi:hypothetical protein
VQHLLESDERLAARWRNDTSDMHDTSRSAVALSLASLLVYRYVPTCEIEAAIRFWCRAQSYDKADRADWLAALLDKAYDTAGSYWSQSHSSQTRRSGKQPPS